MQLRVFQNICMQRSYTVNAEAVVNIDLSRTKQVRQWWPFLRDRRIDEFEPLTRRCCKN